MPHRTIHLHFASGAYGSINSRNKNTEGISLASHDENHRTELTCSMFQNDTRIFVPNEKSITETFNTLKMYCKASGGKTK